MTAGSAAHASGVEVGTLQEYGGSLFGDARIEAAEYAGDTHRLLGVADHQVGGIELAFHAVEGGELGALGASADAYFLACHLVEVEAVEGLTDAQEDEVGDIDDIVDGSLAGADQKGLKPIGRLLHLDIADGDTGISGTALMVHHIDMCGAIGASRFEGGVIGNAYLGEVGGDTLLLQVTPLLGEDIASHAIVAGSVDAVGGKFHLEAIVALDVEIFGGGSAGLHVGIDHDDAVVACADADFVFGAYHTHRLDAADLGLLDFDFLIAVIEDSAYGGNYDGLSGSHIGSATHDLLRGFAAEVDRSDV